MPVYQTVSFHDISNQKYWLTPVLLHARNMSYRFKVIYSFTLKLQDPFRNDNSAW